MPISRSALAKTSGRLRARSIWLTQSRPWLRSSSRRDSHPSALVGLHFRLAADMLSGVSGTTELTIRFSHRASIPKAARYAASWWDRRAQALHGLQVHETRPVNLVHDQQIRRAGVAVPIGNHALLHPLTGQLVFLKPIAIAIESGRQQLGPVHHQRLGHELRAVMKRGAEIRRAILCGLRISHDSLGKCILRFPGAAFAGGVAPCVCHQPSASAAASRDPPPAFPATDARPAASGRSPRNPCPHTSPAPAPTTPAACGAGRAGPAAGASGPCRLGPDTVARCACSAGSIPHKFPRRHKRQCSLRYVRQDRQSVPFLPTHCVVARLLPQPCPKRGHFYRVIRGTFSWSSDTDAKAVARPVAFCYKPSSLRVWFNGRTWASQA